MTHLRPLRLLTNATAKVLLITLLTSSATNKHLDGSFGSKVGLHNVMQTFCCIDVHEKCCTPTHNFGLGVECLDGSHGDDTRLCSLHFAALGRTRDALLLDY